MPLRRRGPALASLALLLAGPPLAPSLARAQPGSGGKSSGLDHLALRGGWDLPPVEPPADTTRVAAGAGAASLHAAIGRIGDGDLAGALAGLRPLAEGRGGRGHVQEARLYSGVALEKAGLPLLAGRAFAASLAGTDLELFREAVRSVRRVEEAAPGAVRLLGLARDGSAPPLPGRARTQLDLARAVELARAGRADQATAALDTVAEAGGVAAVRARLAQAALWSKAQPDRAAGALLEAAALDDVPAGTRDAARVAAARLAFGRGRLGEAEALYRQVDPGSWWYPQATTEAAWTLVRAGQPEEALAALLALADGRHGEVPAPGRVAAALVYLGACKTDRAGALLEHAVGSLAADLEALQELEAAPPGGLLRAVAGKPAGRAARLLLQPTDAWLLRLRVALRAERRRLQPPEGEEGSTLAGSPVAAALTEESHLMEADLAQQVGDGLARRVAYGKEATLHWLRLALALRVDLLEAGKEAARSAAAVGLDPAGPATEGAGARMWSFDGDRWVDPQASAGLLDHGSCPVGDPQR